MAWRLFVLGGIEVKRSCQYCGRVHPVGYACLMKPPKKQSRAKKVANDIRGGWRWQRKREQIQRRDQYLCRMCLEEGQLTYEGLEVHHIVPLEKQPELAYVDENLITLCRHHHEQAERGDIQDKKLSILASAPRHIE